MKKIMTYMNLGNFIGIGVLSLAFLVTASPSVASAASMTRSLDLGMSGSDVTSLQVYLSKDVSVYPQGLVTGYFGQFTKSAVERFQTKEGIVTTGTPTTTGYGRVGPITLAALNRNMNVYIVYNGDVNAPAINSLSVGVSQTSASFNWKTNENTSAIVYYSTSPLQMLEANATNGVYIGGSRVVVNTSLESSHSTTIGNLTSNTTYYYVVYVKDGSGNESITWPATFKTSN